MSTGPSSPTVTALFPYSFAGPFPSCRFLCETWWLCHSTGHGHTWRQRSDSLLTTEQAWSVMPSLLRRRMDTVVSPEPAWGVRLPYWRDIVCDVGRVQVLLAVQGDLILRPFSLLVLLPRQEPPDPLPYAYLGVQFLVEHHVQVQLDCSSGDPITCGGQLIIP